MGNPKTSFLKMEYMGQRMEAKIPDYSSFHPPHVGDVHLTWARLAPWHSVGNRDSTWSPVHGVLQIQCTSCAQCSQNRDHPEPSPRGTSCDRMCHIPKSSLGGKQHSVSTESHLRADLDVLTPCESSSLILPSFRAQLSTTLGLHSQMEP